MNNMDTKEPSSEGSTYVTPRKYKPHHITVTVWEKNRDEEPSDIYVVDMSLPHVPDWIRRFTVYCMRNSKIVEFESTPDAAINFMPNPNKALA